MKDLIVEGTRAAVRRNGHFANFERSRTSLSLEEDDKQGVLDQLQNQKRFDFSELL